MWDRPKQTPERVACSKHTELASAAPSAPGECEFGAQSGEAAQRSSARIATARRGQRVALRARRRPILGLWTRKNCIAGSRRVINLLAVALSRGRGDGH